ncbi:MAG: hypothetical protein QOE58_3480 [Actinomycetota bacterium]|nr:hypothetical protein [Actinomycetota bacterium]
MSRLLDETLPLNRKERFYTGTVLPAIVTAGDFAALDRLGVLMGAPGLIVRTALEDCTVLFFTEYGISESAVGAARERFDGLPTGRDTPDIVILVTEPSPVLLAIEAKLYDRPGGTDPRAAARPSTCSLPPCSPRPAPRWSPSPNSTISFSVSPAAPAMTGPASSSTPSVSPSASPS